MKDYIILHKNLLSNNNSSLVLYFLRHGADAVE